ncbi:hypothetical protein TTHERM_00399380 (macronuclear) [Tetrahymena thermophila SB210]|uniref:START domain-containing protein n=1 Tax=Tetrahymena thermophila (strain SB210) TaxID=312017 RepID=I7M102_TETTS|nr:hypothetical protein TTHERM_00399380 [Tetrahymena thermophila SB210]EAR93766.2 hypothetical protein TTHERM_00399380 [Tetrahymena thermophila SB210]|eukprot:XP_001014011.2 hypothetical protein TTHERM_00399380 [Tetrahymena thermophila SB210]
MGQVCNKFMECFGTTQKEQISNHRGHAHYHRYNDQEEEDGSAINNDAIGSKKSKKVFYSQNQNQQSGSNNKVQKQKNLQNGNQEKLGVDQNNNQQYLDEDEEDSKQRAIKKNESSKYLLKHSNLSAIIEEDEHKDSFRQQSRKLSREAKKNYYKETYDSDKNCILILQNTESNHSLARFEENSFSLIHDIQFGEDIAKFLPDYEKLTAKAMENLTNILNKDYQEEGYTLENNKSETDDSGFYSQVYLKPTEDGKYKYFKIRTEYNLYNCTAREYLQFTTDPIRSMQNNPSIDAFNHVACHDDYHIIYILYKKVLICSPRDFIYLKYNKQIDNNTYISVQFSFETSEFPQYQGKERGIIVLSGSIITEELDSNGNKFIKLSNYAESNLKLTVQHKLMKTSTVKEVSKFINKMQELFLKQSTSQLPKM